MFGKIKYIDDITAVVEIHKENMVVPNLMNLHVIFETKEQKLLGEVKKADEDTVHIDLMGQFVGERFIAGTIKKPTLDSNIRIINDDELNIILGSNKQGNLYLGIPIYDDALMNCISEVRPLDTIEIKSIVTKEQFEKVMYKVGE